MELGYDEAGMTAGIGIARGKLDIADTLKDLQASVEDLSRHGKVGVVGYCFGGLLTWLAACELDGVAGASAYYGGGVVGEIERTARCPVIMHFGELDEHIPMSDVERQEIDPRGGCRWDSGGRIQLHTTTGVRGVRERDRSRWYPTPQL